MRVLEERGGDEGELRRIWGGIDIGDDGTRQARSMIYDMIESINGCNTFDRCRED